MQAIDVHNAQKGKNPLKLLGIDESVLNYTYQIPMIHWKTN